MSISVTEQFEHIMSCQSTRELVPFLLNLVPKDLKSVRTKALEFLKYGIPNARPRTVRGWTIYPPLSAVTDDALAFAAPNQQKTTLFIDPTEEEGALFFLTGLATYTRKEAFGNGFHWAGSLVHDFFHSRREEVRAVLQHARPAWLSDWLMGGFGSSLANYWLLRELEDAGFIEYHPQHFAFRFAWLALDQSPSRLVKRLVEDEKALARDLPLQFEYEVSIARLDGKSAANYEKFTWQRILVDLIKAGHLDRTDILTRCLLALRRDFRRPLLTWFKELFLNLKPTRAERLARQTELTELLAHSLPLVVNFAIEQLKDVWPEPGFALAPLLQAADSLLLRPDLKTGLKTLLAGLAKLPQQQPAHAPAVARLLAAALAHPDAAVQERAAKGLAGLLTAKKPLLPPAKIAETLTALADQAELLGPAARTVLAPWLVAPTPSPAAEATAAYAPLTQFVPAISPATAIAPVADWHELLFLTGQVLRHDDPSALERWLDGLLRLHGQLPAGHAAQLEPYLVLVLPFLKGKSGAQAQAILATNGLRGHSGLAQALLLSWAQGFTSLRVPRVLVQTDSDASDPLVVAEKQRLAAVEQQLQRRTGLLLLSTPTHAPHWVAPATLVQKLLAYEAAQLEPDAADLAIALARTAFANEAAAETARVLLPALHNPELRELLAWFLSPLGAEPPQKIAAPKPFLKQWAERLHKLLPGTTLAPSTLAEALPWLWAVAARTKLPHHVFDGLRAPGAADYPGIGQPWVPKWEFEFKVNTFVETWKPGKPEVTHRSTHLRFPSTYTSQGPPSPLLLYALHVQFRNMAQADWSLGADYPFVAALVPLNLAALHWHVVRTAGWADKLESAEREVIAQTLQTLLAVGPRFEEPTTLVLAVGLLHHTAICRALAQEALLSAVAHQRLVPATLGEALGQLLAADYAPVARLAGGLPLLRAVSPEADEALGQMLEALLPALPPTPLRNLSKLLDAYADLVVRTGRAIPGTLPAQLRSWQGVLTCKKAATALLAC
ncbi:MAG: DUF6493 family protein [Janthinobacterium lividum]